MSHLNQSDLATKGSRTLSRSKVTSGYEKQWRETVCRKNTQTRTAAASNSSLTAFQKGGRHPHAPDVRFLGLPVDETRVELLSSIWEVRLIAKET